MSAMPQSMSATSLDRRIQMLRTAMGPLIATALIAYYSGSYVPVVIFLVLCALVSIVAVGVARDRSGLPLDE